MKLMNDAAPSAMTLNYQILDSLRLLEANQGCTVLNGDRRTALCRTKPSDLVKNLSENMAQGQSLIIRDMVASDSYTKTIGSLFILLILNRLPQTLSSSALPYTHKKTSSRSKKRLNYEQLLTSLQRLETIVWTIDCSVSTPPQRPWCH